MNVEQFVFWFDVAALVFILLSMVFIRKNREYERIDFEKAVNAMMFGFLFLMLVILINVVSGLNTLYPSVLSFLGVDVGNYIENFVNISQIALLPLFGISMLVAVFFAKDALEGFE